jgi:hypothetical protein
MAVKTSFVDCPVIIYGDDNEYITKAIIAEHYTDDMIIRVSDELKNLEVNTQLDLIILHPASTNKYKGITRKVRGGMREIALFNEVKRGARSGSRHTLNAPAFIKSTLEDTKRKVLPEPLKITIVDISTTGVFIKSPKYRFKAGDVLEIEMTIQNRASLLYGKIIRTQADDDGLAGFGCKFVFPANK